jgi:hypothetical protein
MDVNRLCSGICYFGQWNQMMQLPWPACMCAHSRPPTARCSLMIISINFASRIEHKSTISAASTRFYRKRSLRSKRG